jgi:predicted nuclease with TOPRIM domain
MRRILEKWFQGLPRDVIARREHLSGSTVSNIISIVPESIEPLRPLSVELRKLKISPSDALGGVKLLAKLQNLGVQPSQLSSGIRAVRKLAMKEEIDPPELVQSAVELRELEDQAGKPYPEALTEYQKLVKRSDRLKAKTRGQKQELRRVKVECQTQRERLHRLQKECGDAQRRHDQLRASEDELRAHGLHPRDFDTVNNFLNEIRRLAGDAAGVVKVVKEWGSLEVETQYHLRELQSAINFRKKEEQERLAAREEDARLKDAIRGKKETLEVLRREEADLKQNIKNLKGLRQALGQTHDALLQKQAKQLGIQADIDTITEGLQKAQAELAQTERATAERKQEGERIRQENREAFERAEAFAAFWAKRPHKREQVKPLLGLGSGDTGVSLGDALAHQRIVEMMAEHEFVPKARLEEAETENGILKRRLEKREEELADCRKRRKEDVAAKQKVIDQLLDDRAASLIAKTATRAQG